MNKRHNKKQEEKKKRALKKYNEMLWDDCFNLDNSIAEYIYPRLKYFKETSISMPSEFDEAEQWYETLDKIIYAFQYIVEELDYEFDDKESRERHDEGMLLFAKHFMNLWI